MSRLRFYLLFAVLYSCWNIGHSDTVLKPPPPVIIELTKSSDSPVIIPPVIPSDVDKHNTTTSSTTTTTTTTTTAAPNTTTSTTTTTTTTPSPSPTPTPTPAPTPAPGPLPPPDQGQWSYTNKTSNVTCIVVQFAAQLNVTYTKAVENATSLDHVLLNVPANATVLDGSCDADQWITLNWTAPGTNDTNKITLVYHMNKTSNSYGIKSMNISLSAELFVNASSKDPVELYHGAEWQTPLARSYRCNPPTRVNLTSESGSVAALTLSHVQEEAFREVPGQGFSAAMECGGGDVPDAVPIAVGCALGGLVVVVLVAYLVARRRSAARGYLSM